MNILNEIEIILDDTDGYIADYDKEIFDSAQSKIDEILNSGDDYLVGFIATMRQLDCNSATAVKLAIAAYLASLKVAFESGQKSDIDMINEIIHETFIEIIDGLPSVYEIWKSK